MERFGILSALYQSSFDRLLFEHAERVFEEDLVRLDRRIPVQIRMSGLASRHCDPNSA